MLDKNTVIKVTNRDSGSVGYSIPEMGITRLFQRGEVKELTMEELRKLSYLPGGQMLLNECLVVHSEEALEELKPVMAAIHKEYPAVGEGNLGVGSTIFAVKPGDGSAREQAASCQKVLGGWANIANEYATKRYRSNLINWGMLPFIIPDGDLPFANGDYIFLPDIRKAVEEKADTITAYKVGDTLESFTMTLGELTDEEREIILKGCLINYNRVS